MVLCRLSGRHRATNALRGGQPNLCVIFAPSIRTVSTLSWIQFCYFPNRGFKYTIVCEGYGTIKAGKIVFVPKQAFSLNRLHLCLPFSSVWLPTTFIPAHNRQMQDWCPWAEAGISILFLMAFPSGCREGP